MSRLRDETAHIQAAERRGGLEQVRVVFWVLVPTRCGDRATTEPIDPRKRRPVSAPACILLLAG